MPVDVNKLLKLAGAYDEMRGYLVAVNLVIDITAGDEFIDAAIKAFTPTSPGTDVRTVLLADDVPSLPLPCDLCVVVGGSSALLGDVAHEARRMGTPTCVVIERGQTWFSEERPQLPAAGGTSPHWGIPIGDIVDISLANERPFEALGTWICNNAPAKRLSMGDSFPFIRHALGMEVVKAASNRAAAAGVLIFIPGADMPAITFEQSQMVLQIASVYGQPMDLSRAKEIAAVVAGGFAFRSVARQLVELGPFMGIAIKGAVAYGGTTAMGYAVLDYFEGGGVIEGATDVITERVSTVITQLGIEDLVAGFNPDASAQ